MLFERAHDDGAARVASRHCVDGRLDAEGGGGAGDVEVVSPSRRAECVLHLDGHSRVGALEIRAGHQHRVDLFRATPRLVERFEDGRHGDFALKRRLVFRARRQMGPHTLGIEHARFLDHVAVLDPGCLHDEALAREVARLELARLDLGLVGLVPALGGDGERGHQLRVGDPVGGHPEAGPRDDAIVHGCPSLPQAAAG
jgi:hypothetical protein